MEMEKPEEEKLLLSRHFSHEHPLERTSSPPKGDTTCFGCRLNIFPGKDYYKCKTCPFFLHKLCHNMPKKVQHPADPDHHFTLGATTPLSATGPFDCKACGHRVVGFYYNCAKCGDYYHILCSVVPLSVKMPSHIHLLKLEFSPPYDFECDLCKKPSYNGWVYRCGLCEFDGHVSCAITNRGAEWLQHQSTPRYSPLQAEQNSDSTSKGHELMELITRGMMGGTGESVSAEIGTDPSQPDDQLSLLSEDLTMPSYQFSDACFSLDFAKSLLGDEYMDQAKTNGIMDHLKQTNQALFLANKPGFDSRNPKIGLNRAFSTGIGGHVWMELGQESQKRKSNGTQGRTDDDAVIRKSDTESSGSSWWSRLLFCNYYQRNNDRGTKL